MCPKKREQPTSEEILKEPDNWLIVWDEPWQYGKGHDAWINRRSYVTPADAVRLQRGITLPMSLPVGAVDILDSFIVTHYAWAIPVNESKQIGYQEFWDAFDSFWEENQECVKDLVFNAWRSGWVAKGTLTRKEKW